MIKRVSKGTVALVGLILLGLAAGAFIVWPSPDAPKATSRIETPVSAPTTPTATTYIPDPLFSHLKEGGYTHGKFTQRIKERYTVMSHQAWTSPDGNTQVHLRATDSAPMEIDTVTIAGGAGKWQRFWCAPAADETLMQVVNNAYGVRDAVASGGAPLDEDNSFNNGWATCYVA